MNISEHIYHVIYNTIDITYIEHYIQIIYNIMNMLCILLYIIIYN